MDTSDEKRKQTRARVVERIKQWRERFAQLENASPTVDQYGYSAAHIPSVLLACADDGALASFVINFVGEWFGPTIVVEDKRFLTLAELEMLKKD